MQKLEAVYRSAEAGRCRWFGRRLGVVKRKAEAGGRKKEGRLWTMKEDVKALKKSSRVVAIERREGDWEL